MMNTIANQDHQQSPLNLASAGDVTGFVIDPSLAGPSDFFPDPSSHNHNHDHEHAGNQHDHVGSDGAELDVGPTHEEIQAVIQASLEHAQAHVEVQAHAEAIQAEAKAQEEEADRKAALTPSQKPAASRRGENTSAASDVLGGENNPILNATLHLAPFSRPNRTEETPNPEYFIFPSRETFTRWLDAESSWCHFVQRRTTTPDKRSAERLQARIRAHNRALESMTPEERSQATPLKTRRRNRVSPVLEKVTFTCHHAGTYESKHSDALPKDKLRLNTKKSVKCACTSRVVLSEMQEGECKVVYHWKHDGHDPFSDEDATGGRLPKTIDVWVTAQIEAGKTLDDIRSVLAKSDEEKEAYLAKVKADPTQLDPSYPPPLALCMKVKYPDIYNRYRKLKGPVKDNKQLKSATKRTHSGTVKAGSRANGKSKAANIHDESANGGDDATTDGSPFQDVELATGTGTTAGSGSQTHTQMQTPLDHSVQGQEGMILDPSLTDSVYHGATHDGAQGLRQDEGEVDFGSLAPHEGLARALLDLPSGGLRDEDGNEMSLEEAMRRMAEGVASVQGELHMGI